MSGNSPPSLKDLVRDRVALILAEGPPLGFCPSTPQTPAFPESTTGSSPLPSPPPPPPPVVPPPPSSKVNELLSVTSSVVSATSFSSSRSSSRSPWDLVAESLKFLPVDLVLSLWARLQKAGFLLPRTLNIFAVPQLPTLSCEGLTWLRDVDVNQFFDSCPHLTSIDLSSASGLTDGVLNTLTAVLRDKRLEQLGSLSFSDNGNFTSEAMSSMLRVTPLSLSSLSLHRLPSAVGDDLLPALSDVLGRGVLQYLDVSAGSWSSKGLVGLMLASHSPGPSLKTFVARYLRAVDGAVLDVLPNSLTSLDLSYSPSWHGEGLGGFLRRAKGLLELNIMEVPLWESSVVDVEPDCAESLVVTRLHRCPTLTSGTIERLCRAAPKLQKIGLSNAVRLTDHSSSLSGWKFMFTRSIGLVELELTACPQLGDVVVRSLASSSNAKTLRVFRTSHGSMTGQGASMFSSSFPALEELSLVWMNSIDRASFGGDALKELELVLPSAVDTSIVAPVLDSLQLMVSGQLSVETPSITNLEVLGSQNFPLGTVLRSAPRLSRLVLDHPQGSDQEVAEAFTSLKELRSLKLSEWAIPCPLLWSRFSSLQGSNVLSVHLDNVQVTQKMISAMATTFPNLRSIKLHNLPLVESVTESFTRLTTIDVLYLPMLTKISLGSGPLWRARVAECGALKDVAIRSTSLLEVSLANCPLLRAVALDPGCLQTLSLNDCPLVSPDDVASAFALGQERAPRIVFAIQDKVGGPAPAVALLSSRPHTRDLQLFTSQSDVHQSFGQPKNST